MDIWQDISNIENLGGISLKEYLEHVEAGDVLDLFKPYLEGQTIEQNETFMELVRDEIDEIEKQIKDLQDGYEATETDDNKDEIQAAIDELDAIYDELNHAGEDAIDQVEQQWGLFNIASANDLTMSTSDYFNVDPQYLDPNSSDITINVTAMGEDVTMTDPTADFEDMDADGFRSGNDYETWLATQKSFDLSQEFFINLTEDDVVQSISDTEIVIYNAAKGKTFHIMLSGGKMNLFFCAPSDACIPPSSYANCSDDLLGRIYIGEGATESVLEINNPPTLEEKIAMTEGYEAIVSPETLGLAASYTSGLSSSGEVQDLAKQIIDKWFEIMNSTDPLTTFSSIQAEISDVLLGNVPDQLASDAISCAVMALAIKGGENYFKYFCGGTFTAMAEGVYKRDGVLDTTEKGFSIILETQSGSPGGLYGGTAFFPIATTTSDGTTSTTSTGSVFFTDPSGHVSINNEDWNDWDTTMPGIELSQKLVAATGWMSDTQSAATLKALDPNYQMNEQGYSYFMTQSFYDQLVAARYWYTSEDKSDISLVQNEADSANADGISDPEMTSGVDNIMSGMLSACVGATKVEELPLTDMIAAIKTAAEEEILLGVDVEDVLASWLTVMNGKANDLMVSFFIADPGFAQYLRSKLSGGVESDLITQARSLLKTLDTEAQQFASEMK